MMLQEFSTRDPAWFSYEIVEDIPPNIRGGVDSIDGIYDIPTLPGYQYFESDSVERYVRLLSLAGHKAYPMW
jgi:hypothetical protein